jgi:uncharacterized membrane protein YkvA (DUF1232 family)
MLKALKAQLQQLASESDKALERRFHKHVAYDKARVYQDDLKNFVLCLPELLQQTRIWLESDNAPSALKKVYGYLLTYVYHSLDFLPEQDYGFWGYLDDAYFAGIVYQETMVLHPGTEHRFHNDFTQQISDWLKKTREVIPDHTKNIDALFASVRKGDTETFHNALVS